MSVVLFYLKSYFKKIVISRSVILIATTIEIETRHLTFQIPFETNEMIYKKMKSMNLSDFSHSHFVLIQVNQKAEEKNLLNEFPFFRALKSFYLEFLVVILCEMLT